MEEAEGVGVRGGGEEVGSDTPDEVATVALPRRKRERDLGRDEGDLRRRNMARRR